MRRLWLVLVVGALFATAGVSTPVSGPLALAVSSGAVLAQPPGGGADNQNGAGDGGPSQKAEEQGNNSSSGSGAKDEQGDSQNGSGGGSSNPNDSGGQTPAPAADSKPKEEEQGGGGNTLAPQPTNAPASAPRPANEPASAPQPTNGSAPAPRPTNEPAAPQPTAAPKATPHPEPAPGVAPKPTEPGEPGVGTPPNATQPSAPAGAPAGPTPTQAPAAPDPARKTDAPVASDAAKPGGRPFVGPVANLKLGEQPDGAQSPKAVGPDGRPLEEPAVKPDPLPAESAQCADGSKACDPNSGRRQVDWGEEAGKVARDVAETGVGFVPIGKLLRPLGKMLEPLGSGIRNAAKRLFGRSVGAAEEGVEKAAGGIKKPGDAPGVAAHPNKPEDPGYADRLDELANDPAIGNKITEKTRDEARAGLGLEARGDLPGPIKRDPTGKAEFIDGVGVRWDAKAFNSNFPPEAGGFDLQKSIGSIAKEVNQGENVILLTKNLDPVHLTALKKDVKDAGWSDRVLYWP